MQRAARRQLARFVTCHFYHHHHHQIFLTNATFLHAIEAPAEDHHHYLRQTLQTLFFSHPPRISNLRSFVRLALLIRCFSSGSSLPSVIVQDSDVCPSTNEISTDKDTIGVTEDEHPQTLGMKASGPPFDKTTPSETVHLNKEEGLDASSQCAAKQVHRFGIDAHCMPSFQDSQEDRRSKFAAMPSEVPSQTHATEGTHLSDCATQVCSEGSVRCDCNSLFDTALKATKHVSCKDKEKLTADLYSPTGSNGKSFVFGTCTRLNFEEESGTSTDVSIVLLLEKHGWGQYTEDVLHSFIKDLTPEIVGKVVDELGDAKLAFSFLQWAGRQDSFQHKEEIFTKVVGRLGKDRDFEMAWTVLEYMKKQGLKVDYAFGIFVHRLKTADMADSVVKAMDNLVCLDVIPTVPLYTLALQVVLKAQNLEIALKLYTQMRQAGLQPDAKLYGTLITGFGKAGLANDALSFFEEMQRDGIAPDSFAYTRLIRAFAVAGQYAEGQKLFKEMVQNNCLPAALSRDDLECALFGVSSMEQIKWFLKNLESRGHMISMHTYTNMFQYLLDKSLLPEATDFFRSIIGDKRTADLMQKSASGRKLGCSKGAFGQEVAQPKLKSSYDQCNRTGGANEEG